MKLSDYFRYVGGEKPEVGDVLALDAEAAENPCLGKPDLCLYKKKELTVLGINQEHVTFGIKLPRGLVDFGWYPARFRLLRRKDEPKRFCPKGGPIPCALCEADRCAAIAAPPAVERKCEMCGDRLTVEPDEFDRCSLCDERLCEYCCERCSGRLPTAPAEQVIQPPCEHCHRLEFERTERPGEPVRCPVCQRIIKEEMEAVS